MNEEIFTLLLLLSGILFFTACDKDEPIEYEYRMVVTCDTPDQEFIVQMAHRANFTTKNRFEFADRTTDDTFGGIIYCANPKAVITGSALSQWQTLQKQSMEHMRCATLSRVR